MPAKVAILQNQFRLSGRTRVVCEVIDILNQMGIVPDVLSLTHPSIGSSVGQYFGLGDLGYQYRQVAPLSYARGWLWQILLLNALTYRQQQSYDLVFNSNNTLNGLNPDARFVHYVYYPVGLSPKHLTQFQEFTQSPLRFAYGAALGAVLRMRPGAVPDHNLYTISEFSRRAVILTYPDAAEQTEIIYPISYDGTVCQNRERSLTCVSIGSITPDKRQMEQIKIAKRLPSITFWIVGAAKSRSYLQAIQDVIAAERIENVRIVPDMPRDDLKRLLESSMFFLHTKIDEHFGISTVEAIAAGCIPVTHDSGGQKEVVPLSDLRYSTVSEAVEVFERLLQPSAHLDAVREQLQKHIEQFGRGVFRARMCQALEKQLSG